MHIFYWGVIVKKGLIIICMLLLFVPNICHAEDELAVNAKSAILVDVNTGTIIF